MKSEANDTSHRKPNSAGFGISLLLKGEPAAICFILHDGSDLSVVVLIVILAVLLNQYVEQKIRAYFWRDGITLLSAALALAAALFILNLIFVGKNIAGLFEMSVILLGFTLFIRCIGLFGDLILRITMERERKQGSGG